MIAPTQNAATEPERLRLLLEVTNAIVSTRDLPALVDAVSSSVARAIPHELVALALDDEDHGDLVVRAAAAKSGDPRNWVGTRLTGSAVHAAFTARRTLLAGEDELTAHFADAGVRSLGAVPLVADDRALGMLVVGHRERDAFTPAAVATIEAIGRQVAVAVANVLAFRQEEHLSGDTTLQAVERTHILRILRETNWVLGGPRGAAARLGMKRTTLQSLMRRLGITRPRAA